MTAQHDPSRSPVPDVAKEAYKGALFEDMATHIVGQAAEIVKLQEERDKDSKTKLLTYPAFTERVKKILARANDSDSTPEHRKRSDRFSLIIADLDDFKKRNTELGYQEADDSCLIPTAEIVRSVTDSVHRTDDVITETSRFGGEEFIVFLGGTDLEGATEVARTIKERVNNIFVDSPEGRQPLGICMGVVAFGPDTELEAAFSQANSALQIVKDRPGKNQVLAVHFSADLAALAEPPSG